MNHSNTPLRVGIADDLRSDRLVLAEMLKALGHEVVFEVQTGKELLEACGRCHPDLVITDNLMPDLSGLEAAARISVPVILLSAHSDPASVMASERVQIAMYLVKPLEISNLEKAIALVLECRADAQPNEGFNVSMRNYHPSGFAIDPARNAEPGVTRCSPGTGRQTLRC